MGKVIIIAEIGECYNGDLERALAMITIAHEAGCDIAKFQTLDPETISDDDPEREWFKKIALNPEMIACLVARARATGIDILFTPENVKTAQWLLPHGLRQVKIASSSVADTQLVRFINRRFDKVFMSTGMASLEEVHEAVQLLQDVRDLYIMHCISEYPTGPLLEQRGLRALAHEDVRLNMMQILMETFPRHNVGYSDHTDGILAPVAAVAMGARVIEKHFTLDRKTPIRSFVTGGEYMGTDHVLSVEPPELAEMVRQIREVEKMFGEPTWRRTHGEAILRDFLRGRFGG